jgi:hypothetical protein
MKTRYLSVSALLLYCALSWVACQNEKKKRVTQQMEQRFDWSPGVGAANFYPMELYRCSYSYPNGEGVAPASPSLDHGNWGEENGSSVVGQRMKPIPVALDIAWLSYTENKFYKGHFNLPYDKILQLFKQGYKDLLLQDSGGLALQQMEYNSIIAGLAPGGVVVVWVSGGPFTVEAARFQAVETKIKMEDFAPGAFTNDRATYVKRMMKDDKEVHRYLAKNGIRFGLWDKYRERFNQRPVVKFNGDVNLAINSIDLGYFNGEREKVYGEKWFKNNFKPRARTKEMRVEWTGTSAGGKTHYILDVKFDEEEMFKAYEEAYADNTNQPGELITEIDRANDQYKIYLRVGNKNVALTHQEGRISIYNEEE